MTRMASRLLAVLTLFVVVGGSLAVAGCGDGVPAGAVAKVGDTLVTQAQFDELMNRLRTQAQNRSLEFPAADSPTYKSYAAGIVTYLVQAELVSQRAATLEISVGEKELARSLKEIAAQNGGEEQLAALLAKLGMSAEMLEASLRTRLLTQRVKDAVVKDVAVSDQECRSYWDEHSADFQKEPTRTVRQVLVRTRAAADKVRDLLVGGASWQAVAREYSKDKLSRTKGGRLGVVEPDVMVEPLDRAVFSLEVGDISQPVRTGSGWHVLQVTSATPGARVTYAQARQEVEDALLPSAREEAWQAWLAKAAADAPVRYAAAYDPERLKAAASASATAQ